MDRTVFSSSFVLLCVVACSGTSVEAARRQLSNEDRRAVSRSLKKIERHLSKAGATQMAARYLEAVHQVFDNAINAKAIKNKTGYEIQMRDASTKATITLDKDRLTFSFAARGSRVKDPSSGLLNPCHSKETSQIDMLGDGLTVSRTQVSYRRGSSTTWHEVKWKKSNIGEFDRQLNEVELAALKAQLLNPPTTLKTLWRNLANKFRDESVAHTHELIAGFKNLGKLHAGPSWPGGGL